MTNHIHLIFISAHARRTSLSISSLTSRAPSVSSKCRPRRPAPPTPPSYNYPSVQVIVVTSLVAVVQAYLLLCLHPGR